MGIPMLIAEAGYRIGSGTERRSGRHRVGTIEAVLRVMFLLFIRHFVAANKRWTMSS